MHYMVCGSVGGYTQPSLWMEYDVKHTGACPRPAETRAGLALLPGTRLGQRTEMDALPERHPSSPRSLAKYPTAFP